MIIDFLVDTVKVWSGGQYVTTGPSLSVEKKKERLKKEKNINNCNVSVIDLKIIENLKSKR